MKTSWKRPSLNRNQTSSCDICGTTSSITCRRSSQRRGESHMRRSYFSVCAYAQMCIRDRCPCFQRAVPYKITILCFCFAVLHQIAVCRCRAIDVVGPGRPLRIGMGVFLVDQCIALQMFFANRCCLYMPIARILGLGLHLIGRIFT